MYNWNRHEQCSFVISFNLLEARLHDAIATAIFGLQQMGCMGVFTWSDYDNENQISYSPSVIENKTQS